MKDTKGREEHHLWSALTVVEEHGNHARIGAILPDGVLFLSHVNSLPQSVKDAQSVETPTEGKGSFSANEESK